MKRGNVKKGGDNKEREKDNNSSLLLQPCHPIKEQNILFSSSSNYLRDNQCLFTSRSQKKNAHQFLHPHKGTHKSLLTEHCSQHVSQYLICKQLYPVTSKHVIWRSKKKKCVTHPLPILKYSHLFFASDKHP